jgi:hypothetical protein
MMDVLVSTTPIASQVRVQETELLTVFANPLVQVFNRVEII